MKNVYIANNVIKNSQNGIRIKTVYQASGTVQNVTYYGNSLSGITKYGIDIQQDYENGSPTGGPTNGVAITDLTVEKNTGTVASSGTNVYILCGSGSCTDWTFSGNSITGGKSSTSCKNIPKGSGASC